LVSKIGNKVRYARASVSSIGFVKFATFVEFGGSAVDGFAPRHTVRHTWCFAEPGAPGGGWLECRVAATNGNRRLVAVLEEDLFFLGKIAPAVAAAGLEMVIFRPGERLPDPLAGLIVDLTDSGDWESVVQSVAARAALEIIGFGPHVDGALMKRGRKAGCTRVMARSKFAQDLPGILARWAAPARAHL